MAVILFHTFPRYLPGGFVGVDIFFVISGYLITQIIVSDLNDGTFSAANFYARRIRRIFPALIVVLIATFALGWQFLLPAELASLCKNILASAFFSANLMLLSEVSYFDLDAHMKPLLHLWSLGIEEQFYLVWPWVLWMMPRRWLRPAIVLMIAGSFILNLLILSGHPSATFYLPFTRAWELLAGALLTQIPKAGQQARETLGAYGLCITVTSFFLFNAHTPFPGWAAAVPVTGAALILMSEGSLTNRFVFTHRLAVNVGLISYPLYLWHWPLLVFAEIRKFSPLTDLEHGLIIGATFALSWLTYRLLEQPISASGNRFVTALSASMVAVAVLTQAPLFGYRPKFPDQLERFVTLPTGSSEWRLHECMLINGDRDFAPSCIDPERPLIALWGDSSASALMPGLRELQSHYRFGIAQFTKSGCSPLLVMRPAADQSCVDKNHEVLQRLAEAHPRTVLLHSLWYTTNSDDLRPTIDALRSIGVDRIIVLGKVTIWTGGLPNAVATYYWRRHELLPERTALFVDPQYGEDPLKVAANKLGVEYISLWNLLCDKVGCLTRIGADLIISDWLHFTPEGSKYVMKMMGPAFLGSEDAISRPASSITPGRF
jgi:peptidoglycan/LPS O-acetylase OafA/YrhL